MKKILASAFLVCLIVIGASLSAGKTASAKYEYKEGFSYTKLPKSVKKRINGKSYRKNKYINYDDLRYLTITHYNYKGKVKTGEMIVNKAIAKDVLKVFYELYEIEYPIRRMKLVDEYDADDNKSMEADNTSCFNFRIIEGSNNNLSMHALGLAIDLNPKINPCVGGAHGIVPANGKVYAQRDVKKCKGMYADVMIHKNDKVYNIFKKHGFKWGGDWNNMKDYQHFYKMTSKYNENIKYEW